jgi:hypothetical protein
MRLWISLVLLCGCSSAIGTAGDESRPLPQDDETEVEEGLVGDHCLTVGIMPSPDNRCVDPETDGIGATVRTCLSTAEELDAAIAVLCGYETTDAECQPLSAAEDPCGVHCSGLEFVGCACAAECPEPADACEVRTCNVATGHCGTQASVLPECAD